jgi:hypothetical protein
MLLVSNVATGCPEAAPIGSVGLVVVVTRIRPTG